MTHALSILSAILTAGTIGSLIVIVLIVWGITHFHNLSLFRINLISGKIVMFKSICYADRRKGVVISVNIEENRVLICDTDTLESHFVKLRKIFPFKQKTEIASSVKSN